MKKKMLALIVSTIASINNGKGGDTTLVALENSKIGFLL